MVTHHLTSTCGCDTCPSLQVVKHVNGPVTDDVCRVYLASLGWKSKQVNGQWRDSCPKCLAMR